MRILGFSLLLCALCGCSTTFYGSAPSGVAGQVYVVGNDVTRHAIWLCPVDGDDDECTPVEIEE